MKKTIYLLLVISSSFIMNSCSSDDDSGAQEKENFIKVGDVTNKLAFGIAEDYGDAYNKDNVYNIDLTFLTSEFTVDGDDYQSPGFGVYFEILSSVPNKLAPGIYQYNQSDNALSFGDAYYFDFSGTDSIEIEIVSGTITVVKSEKDYYELTFKCVDELERTITGRYYGNVNYSPNLNP